MTQTITRRPTFASAQEAIARARELAPGIRARVPQAEQLRRLPDDTVRELHESGLFLILVPRSMGGSELNYDAALDITIALGEARASTGWVYSLLTAHTWLLAQFPEHIQHEIFDAPNPLASSCVSTVGVPTRVEGGYRWTGRGFFSSGVDHAAWLTPAMLSPSDDGTMERRWFLLRKGEFEIVDDWFTMGLKGTGSKTVVVNDAFFPDERVLAVKDLQAGKAPGAAIHSNVFYRAGIDFTFSLPVAMPSVGAAQGFLKAVEERLKSRITGSNPVLAREAMGSLARLAHASAQIDAARAVLLNDVHRYCFSEASNFEDIDKTRVRRDTSFVAQMCRQAVNELFEASGGSALYEASDMQRLWRDANAAAAHHGLTWDIRGVEYGRVMMGLPATEQGAGSVL
jgi:3-hydroxy-9,10-secoandrosta-1,3,5(10)-triene-9,17-dione monooxygenase